MSLETGKTTLLLGLGNEILSDDAIGLMLCRAARDRLVDWPEIEVCASEEMGLSLLDLMVGYSALVLVDAVQTRQAPPGFLHELEVNDLKVLPAMTPHFLGIGEILALGRKLEMPMPQQVRIFAIEVADPFQVRKGLTPALAEALPSLVERVVAAVQSLARPTNTVPAADATAGS